MTISLQGTSYYLHRSSLPPFQATMSDISDTSDIADESLLSSSDDASVGCSPTGSLPDADDSFDPPDGHPTLINLPPPAQPPPNPPLTPAQRVLSIPELITLIATHHLSPAPFMNIRSINRTIRSAIDRSHATWRLAYGAMFDLQPALAQLVQKEAEEARTKLHCGGGRAWFRTSETGFNGWVGRYLLLLRMTARAGVVVVPVWVPAPGRRMVEMGFRGLEGNEAQMLFTLKAMMMSECLVEFFIFVDLYSLGPGRLGSCGFAVNVFRPSRCSALDVCHSAFSSP